MRKVLFVRPNKDSFGYKPIGISLLSAIAKNLGWSTKLFDTTEIDFGTVESKEIFESAKVFKPVDFSKYGLVKQKVDLKEKFTSIFQEYNPEILAFSVLSDQYIIAEKINRIAKSLSEETVTIWGGTYPTLRPKQTIVEQHADFVCVGEGIEAFADFLKAFEKNEDLFNILNIWGSKNGKIVQNDVRPLKKNLDDLPFLDWTIFDKKSFYKPYDGEMYIGGDHMLNWGCPYHLCTYCINRFYSIFYGDRGGYFIRRYSNNRIIAELKFLKEKYGLEVFKFFDEDFLARPLENLKELSEAYQKEVKIPFFIETNPKTVTKEKVELLKQMNCVSVSMGVEAGSSMRKSLLGRVDTDQEVVRAFYLFKKAGIRTVAFNMLGLPFETRKTYEKRIELNKKANPQYPQIFFFFPFEGTLLRDISIKEGYYNPNDEVTAVYRYDKPALKFKGLRDEELLEMLKVFILYIKLPKEYSRFIRRSETQDEMGMELRKKLLEIYDNTVWKNDGWYLNDGKQSQYISELKGLMN